MITFGAGVTVIGLYWTAFKAMLTAKSLVHQYDDDGSVYTVFGIDGPLAYSCPIWKGTVPPGVIDAGYSQVQNDADKADFVTNFLPTANRAIDHPEAKVINGALKNGSSSNLAVNGSATPVEFSYSPGASYDTEIDYICIIAETVNGLSLGNKFIDTTIATLTNGLLIEVKAGDLAYTWQNCKRTRDLVEIADHFDMVTSTPNLFYAALWLPKRLRLFKAGTFTNGDYLRVTVRDDLRAITFIEMFYQGVKL